MTKRLKVVVASASPVIRSRIARVLEGEGRVEFLGSAGDLSQAFTLCESLEPEVVFVGESLAALREFEGMKSLFYALDARYVRILNSPPQGVMPNDLQMSEAPMAEPMIHPAMSRDEIWCVAEKAASFPRKSLPKLVMPSAPRSIQRPQKLVVIGASTGGIDALLTLLSSFPPDCPPTAIVQHTGRGFGESLVRLLSRRCSAEVVPAKDGMPLISGRVCIAAGTGAHLTLHRDEPNICRLQDGPPIAGHIPSVDALFRSAAAFAPKVVGALLTGMGQDGADGLLQLRRAGCATIAQDEATSTVYGMPRVAWAMGAVDVQLPIDRIAAEILRMSGRAPSQQLVSS